MSFLSFIGAISAIAGNLQILKADRYRRAMNAKKALQEEEEELKRQQQ